MYRSCEYYDFFLQTVPTYIKEHIMIRSLSVPSLLLISLSSLAISAPAEKAWYRGNTHTHTFWSDGNDFPEMAANWYKQHGYQFVVLTDHNIMPDRTGWKNIGHMHAEKPGDKLAAAFGQDAVVTRENAKGQTEHRLLSYKEVAARVDVPGTFVAVPGEELTNTVHPNPVHMNAVNTTRTLGAHKHPTVREMAINEAARARALEAEQKRPIFIQLNHPNWRWDMPAEVLAEALEADGFELVNPSCHNLGNDTFPGSERMWDIAATLRLKKYQRKPIWAVAADDTHNYHDFANRPQKANPGRAFVMARAESLNGDALAQALKDGDFYASTGVILDTVQYDAASRQLTVTVDPADPGTAYTIQVIGTKRDASIASEPGPDVFYSVDVKQADGTVKKEKRPRLITRTYSKDIGQVLQTLEGKQTATFTLPDNLLYARCKVVDTSHPGFTWGDETVPRAAWTQPVGWDRFLNTRAP